MKNIIHSKISTIDWLEQEKLFYIQKYKDFKINKELLKNFDINFWIKTKLEVDKEGNYITEQNNEIKLVELYNQLNDDSEFRKIITNYFKENLKFNFKGELLNITEVLKKTKNPKIVKEYLKKIDEEISFVMQDLYKYKKIALSIDIQLKSAENISWENKNIWDIVTFYRNTILKEITDSRKINQHVQTEFDSEFDDDLFADLGLDKEFFEEHYSKELEDLVWKYNFFKIVQNSVENGYIFTKNELDSIESIAKDLRKWKVVLLTWDTWSWKTELAKFLCREILKRWKSKKDAFVFLSWSKDLETSDFTMEKAVTSKWIIDTDNNIVTWEKNTQKEVIDKKAIDYLKHLMKTKEFKKAVLENTDSIDHETIKQHLQNLDFDKKSLITEYHLMAYLKACKLWVPLIIDEVNLIRPEVFMALNDLLVKKAWDTIQLPNALWEIKVKKWFCTILTWNDPEQNKKAWNYTSWRYNFDEAIYNRLRVYAKNYFTQINEEKTENKLDELDLTYSYLDDNEMFWVILMMMFQEKNSRTTAWKYGYEIMKRDMDWEIINKETFFENMKKYAVFISLVQKAYAKETISNTTNSTFSISENINRKVFSMRNLIEVFEEFKNDNKCLEYHLYNEFIKHTTNKDEQYSLALIAKEAWLFGELITDNQKNTLQNMKTFVSHYNISYNIADIENKFIITKQDLYKQYFWTFELSDNFFEENLLKIDEIAEQNKKDEDNFENSILSEDIEICWEDLVEFIKSTTAVIDEKINYILDVEPVLYLIQYLNFIEELITQDSLEKDKFSQLNSLITEIYNFFDNIWEDSDTIDLKEKINKFNKDLTEI